MANKHRKAATVRRRQLAIQPWQIGVGLITLALISVVAFMVSGSAQPKAEVTVKGAPSLNVDRNQVDLGDVKLGQTVAVSFVIANVGDKPLRFSEPPYIEVVEGC